VVESEHPDIRRLFNNIVRYLYNVGDTAGSLSEADRALAVWGAEGEPDDRNVLIAARRKADALWSLGRYQEAYEQRRDTMDRTRVALGESDPETLLVTIGHGADLRVRGDFSGARALDQEVFAQARDVWGEDYYDTFIAANNLALDYELTSDYARAQALDERTLQSRRDFFGRDDDPNVIFSLNAVSRDIRQAGKYRQARGLAEQAHQLYQQVTSQGLLPKNHAWVLLQAKDLSVARRLDGDFEEALALARETFSRYEDNFVPNHPDTLAAAINLGNSLRRVGSLEPAAEIIEKTVEGYRGVLITDHPYTHASILNLAVIRRQIGRDTNDRSLVEDSKDKLEDALAGLERSLGPNHHFTLTCKTSLAAAVADLGDVERARDLDEAALPLLTEVLGPDHPHTLMCAANLALDLRGLHAERQADVLAGETLSRYQQGLGARHTDVLEMAKGNRLDFVFEPSPF
jgi:tetratricopeptide (TPR) repeat protein